MAPGPGHETAKLWIERLAVADFRNYTTAELKLDARPVVLTGANGSGKTNILEAVSLLAAGQGLRRAAFSDLARAGGERGWRIAARVHTHLGPIDIGTGLAADTRSERAARSVRIDGDVQSSSGVLADYVEMVWLTPATDGLFTGPASERRRFLDRLILAFDPAHRTRSGHFERAMAARNRLLADGVTDRARLEGFEIVMAESGVAIAAARAEALAALAAVIASRRVRDPGSPFPWSRLAMVGTLEAGLAGRAAVDVEDDYLRVLAQTRERDRAAGRTLDGPHRSDLAVHHGPKEIEARLSSTGEQKALLLGIVLAHAELVAERNSGVAPILLLDEVTAHLDGERRASLFAELLRLGTQAWLSGTDASAFETMVGSAQFWRVDSGQLSQLSR